KVVHYGEAEEAFASEDPFVRQFLSGESAGPLGMD
ncbi:MAG: phospholipid/cholesterol/gamma-HCH transport system ATP-binding protein, partial [Pseudonocardiales bacterium]|nr:phospholipid/cholesterol/gamma-HCH transport system ATP-binding protein [Pseudonocardiales bacterium]MDT7693221.1 phospholipid/cholesterol/gamma-HCH transport system ATP-binding protein [Pseudonocardiales bacterium]